MTNYFSKRTEIVGGRYGCVQYVKQKGPKPLRECSLGRISMYVQEAINQGFIRYHKTQLVSNRQEQPLPNTPQQETSWEKLQREVKVGFLQLALIDILLEAGPKVQIPLAQIPLNLKKTLLFDINLLELGFPKLKNLLSTLSSKLRIETNKTHISY